MVISVINRALKVFMVKIVNYRKNYLQKFHVLFIWYLVV